jgi:hypothetical protein
MRCSGILSPITSTGENIMALVEAQQDGKAAKTTQVSAPEKFGTLTSDCRAGWRRSQVKIMESPKGKKASSANKAVAEFLAGFTPEVRKLALQTRAFVLKMIPNSIEQVDAKSRIIGYGFGPKYADTVCIIMPTKAGVNLGIAYAMELPDPQKILEGTGKLHRHVRLKESTDLDTPALKALLLAALARREKAGQKSEK